MRYTEKNRKNNEHHILARLWLLFFFTTKKKLAKLKNIEETYSSIYKITQLPIEPFVESTWKQMENNDLKAIIEYRINLKKKKKGPRRCFARRRSFFLSLSLFFFFTSSLSVWSLCEMRDQLYIILIYSTIILLYTLFCPLDP